MTSPPWKPFQDLATGIAADGYSKFRSPVYLTFIIAVLLWNWELTIYILMSEEDGWLKIERIREGEYAYRIKWPFITTAAIHLLYPIAQISSDKWTRTVSAALSAAVDGIHDYFVSRRKALAEAMRHKAQASERVSRITTENEGIETQIEQLNTTQRELMAQSSDLLESTKTLTADLAETRKTEKGLLTELQGERNRVAELNKAIGRKTGKVHSWQVEFEDVTRNQRVKDAVADELVECFTDIPDTILVSVDMQGNIDVVKGVDEKDEDGKELLTRGTAVVVFCTKLEDANTIVMQALDKAFPDRIKNITLTTGEEVLFDFET